MDEYYRVPTLALLSILVAVFAVLYARARTLRTLLWLLGWSMAITRLAMQGSSYGRHGIGLAISNTAMALAALMLLGSVSPIHVQNKIKASYIAVFAAPLILYSVLTSLYPDPGVFLQGSGLGGCHCCCSRCRALERAEKPAAALVYPCVRLLPCRRHVSGWRLLANTIWCCAWRTAGSA